MMNSTELIQKAKDSFKELKHKGYEWKSFYNGFLIGFSTKVIEDVKLSIEDFHIGFEYEELQLDSNRYLNRGLIWYKKKYNLNSPKLHKMNELIINGKVRKIEL